MKESTCSFAAPIAPRRLLLLKSQRDGRRTCPKSHHGVSLRQFAQSKRTDVSVASSFGDGRFGEDDDNAYAQLPPGTTSLLLALETTDVNAVQKWLTEWLRVYMFGATGTMAVPVSLKTDGHSAELLFYSSAGLVRGAIALSAAKERSGRDWRRTIVRVASSSRFRNASGSYTVSLPGERRIVRTLFADISAKYPSVAILYKPQYIRLRRPVRLQQQADVPVVAFVAEVRDPPSLQAVVTFLQNWGVTRQFGALSESHSLNIGWAPPLTSTVTDSGVSIEVQDGQSGGPTACVTATARVKSRSPKTLPIEHTQTSATTNVGSPSPESAAKTSVIVIVSTSALRSKGVAYVLRGYVANFDILARSCCRILRAGQDLN